MSQHIHSDQRQHASDLKALCRNRYFYGKLLDEFHLNLEQEYFNSKRWLLNRLVTGPGVVCGLDVMLTDDKKGVIVTPGLAIDRCGREIIVPAPSKPVALPPLPPYGGGEEQDRGYGNRGEAKVRRGYAGRPERHNYCENEFAHIVLCYHECEADPVPATAGPCESIALCASGSICEQYEIKVRDGEAPERKSNFPDVIDGNRINHAAIVTYVTRQCRPVPDDCCLPLADILLKDVGDEWEPEVDINIRTIVFTNRLLYELILSVVNKEETDY